MSTIDRILERISEHNVSDKEILQLMSIADNFASQHPDNPSVLDKVAQAKGAMLAKMGNKEIVYDEKSQAGSRAGENDEAMKRGEHRKGHEAAAEQGKASAARSKCEPEMQPFQMKMKKMGGR